MLVTSHKHPMIKCTQQHNTPGHYAKQPALRHGVLRKTSKLGPHSGIGARGYARGIQQNRRPHTAIAKQPWGWPIGGRRVRYTTVYQAVRRWTMLFLGYALAAASSAFKAHTTGARLPQTGRHSSRCTLRRRTLSRPRIHGASSVLLRLPDPENKEAGILRQ